MQWLMSFREGLRQRGQQAGLGFHIPDDDPKDRTKQAIGVPNPVNYYQATAGVGLQPVDVAQAGGPGTSPVLYPDPITGEDMATDWKVKLAFKVKLGEKGAAAAEPEAGAKPGAGAQPARSPARGRGGVMAPPPRAGDR
jgi:hypothetical protein